MKITQFFQLLVVVIFNSFAQVFLKISANRLDSNNDLTSWGDIWLILGIGTYILSMLLWLKIIKNIPLSLATPISGFTFVLVPLLCYTFLNEKLTTQYFIGSIIIMLGILLISRSL